MRLLAPSLVIVVAGCGPATAPPAETARVVVAAPEISHADFGVAPAELGDADVWTRVRHRARVIRFGEATFVPGGERADERDSPSPNVELPIFPVIGESGDHVRVVVDGDLARIALWVPTRDIAPTALAPVRLGDERGRADPVSGVTLGAGASIRAQPAVGGLRAVTLVSEYLDASGFAPAAALGAVWLASEHEGYDPGSVNVSEPGPNPTGTEVAAGPIRDAPRNDAIVVATAKQPLPVRIVRALGPWDEVEIYAQRVRVHGYVPTPAVTEHAPPRGYGGYGHGGGYGMSDSLSVAVPDGVCLYDCPGGEVIGVEVGAKTRYSHGSSTPGWWSAAVYNDWGILEVEVHDVSAATDPNAASWETCKK